MATIEKGSTSSSSKAVETAASSKTAAALSNRATTKATLVTVDIGDKPTISSVVRNGVALEPPVLNPARVTDLIGRLGPIQRPSLPRVLSQSVQAGQRVNKGMVVDIVLVPVTDIKFDLLDNVHEALLTQPITAVHPITTRADIKPLLAKTSDPTTLNTDERAKITSALAGINVVVDDTQPTRSFAAAFSSLKAAQAFE